MKKWLIFLLIMVAVLLLLVGFSIRPVDYTPYFKTEYYRQTRAQLETRADSLQTLLNSTSQPTPSIQIGFGKASITPGAGVPLAGYASRDGRSNTGIHDSLFAKALAIQAGANEVMLVSIDALIFSRAMADTVLKIVAPTMDLRRGQIIFGATHTHSGPGGWEDSYLGKIFAGSYQANVFRLLTQQIAQAMQIAHQDLQPGCIGFATLNLPQYVKNRLVKKLGRIDPEFNIMLSEQNSGTRIVSGCYAAHATTIDDENMQYSGDYPGYWQRRIEQQPGHQAIFWAGGVGSHGPNGEGRNFGKAQFIGEALADSVLKHLSTIPLTANISVFSLGVPVALPEPQIRLTDHWRLAPWLARKIMLKDQDSYLNLIGLGRTLIFGVPADFSGELASQLKDFAWRRGYRASFTSFNGSYVGYIIPSKYYHLNSYESRTMSFFGPAMGDYFPDLIKRMMVSVIN